MDYPEAVLRLLDTHDCEEGIYRTILKKYGFESQCDYDQRMMILKNLFNAPNLPPDMYPVMMRKYPSLVHYGEGRSRFLNWAVPHCQTRIMNLPDKFANTQQIDNLPLSIDRIAEYL